MNLTLTETIGLLTLVSGWLCSLALVWWKLASRIEGAEAALARYKVEVERRLGEGVTRDHFDARLDRLADAFQQQIADLRSSLMPSSRR